MLNSENIIGPELASIEQSGWITQPCPKAIWPPISMFWQHMTFSLGFIVMAIIFLLILSAVQSLQTEFTFENQDLVFNRQLLGEGFKKELKTTITLKNSESLQLTENITKDWFVDKEEFPKTLNCSFPELIDIELPATLSKDHVFHIHFSQRVVSFTYPIHIRYNKPALNNKYKLISLPGPTVYVGSSKVEIPDKLEAIIPVGVNSHMSIVIIGTIFSVSLALLTILGTLSNKP